jgi:Uncharacterized conserved protein
MKQFKVLALASAVVFGLRPDFVGGESDGTEPFLTVVGVGEATAQPNRVEIQIGVVTEANTAREALDANSAAMKALFKTVSAFEIKEHDVQTTAFNVSPLYSREGDGRQPPRIVGYEVENRIGLKVRTLQRLGELLDALVTKGANKVHGIYFNVSELNAVLDQARRAAVADAQRKAELYAKAAGTLLGRVIEIREEELSHPPPQPVFARSMAMEANVPVAPGESTYTARVVITYEIVGQ